MIDWLNPSDDVLDARSIGFAEGQQSRDEEVEALTAERDALAAELARLRTLEAALPKTADGVAIVPGMTIYDRWLPEGWLVTGFDTTDGRLTCLYTKQGFDAICSGYYSTREAAEAAREAAEKARNA